MNTEESKITDDSSLLHSRLYINQLIRFILDEKPNRDSFAAIVNTSQFESLCEISEAASLIKIGIESLLTSENELLAKEEYNRLFVGPNMLPAPLWESVYLGREHLLFEEETLKVRECYRQYGLSFVRENNEPDDHIVIELEFLGYLIQKTLETTNVETKQKLLADQQAFLDDHLFKWGLSFCEHLNNATAFELYRGAAQLLAEYIRFEMDIIPFLKEALENE
ncbi:molecular chaperone TorD family protein [Neobacillus sp. FSL H8-0543]|uniref:TorD/DmsD family molecular chaperone n=1 Tax=Neobacillus sp. FSL H8-0543 TaxID=2954672 RepID=UPI0031595F27